MKNKLLIIVIFLMAVVAQAQDSNKPEKELYQSYFGNDSTNINQGHIPCQSADFELILSGVIYTRDTIRINGYLYYYSEPKPLETMFKPEYNCLYFLFPRQDTLFLREERETGRLYRYYRNYFGFGETEKLICDMTLEVGDKFSFPNHYCLGEDSLSVIHVDNSNGIKTILFGGDLLFKEGQFPSQFPLWQEPLPDMYENWWGSADMSWLICEYKDGEPIYIGHSGCFYNTLSIEENYDKPVSVYPNVIRNTDILTIQSDVLIKDVVVIDMYGRTQEITANQINNNLWQISISNKCSLGLHFVNITTDKGVNYEKIMLLD